MQRTGLCPMQESDGHEEPRQLAMGRAAGDIVRKTRIKVESEKLDRGPG